MSYSPWRDAAARFPGVHIERASIWPAHGVWLPGERVVLLARQLTVAQARHTLAHELAHMDLEHEACDGVGPDGWRLGLRREREAELLAISRLVAVEELAAVMRWTADRDEIGLELRVPRLVVDLRLEFLTPRERHYLMERTGHHREWAT